MDRQKALHVIKSNWPDGRFMLQEALRTLIPEFNESEEDAIKKFISNELACLRATDEKGSDRYEELTTAINWIEKHSYQKSTAKIQIGKEYKCIASPRYSTFMVGEIYKPEDKFLCSLMNFCSNCFEPIDNNEQKPIDKTDHKFKVGDWIINSEGLLRHIVGIDKAGYQTDNGWLTHEDYEKNFHLWTIQDAKEGDVLYTSSTASNEVFIFKGLSKEGDIECYCSYDSEDKYCDGEYHFIGKPGLILHPAIKEKRDLLFTKMKEAGYEWDAEKKELKKIEQKPKIYDSMDDLIADALIEEIENSELDDRGKYNRIIWIKSHRKKPAWSEDDDNLLEHSLENLGEVRSRFGGVYGKVTQCINWLESIKDRMKGE